MQQSIYTTEERRHLAEEAEAYVKAGKGTATDFARMHGVKPKLMHNWMRYRRNLALRGTEETGRTFVPIGKPAVQDADMPTVSFHGADIVVRNEHQLAMVLRAVLGVSDAPQRVAPVR